MLKKILVNTPLIIITNSLLQVLLLLYLKLLLHNLNASQFNLFYFGNLLNFIPILILVLTTFITKSEYTSVKTIILLLSFIAFIPLIFNFLIIEFNYNIDVNLFGYSGRKIAIATFFMSASLIPIVISFIQLLSNSRIVKLKPSWLFVIITVVPVAIYIFAAILNFSFIIKNHSEPSKYEVGVVLGAAVWKGNIPSPIFRNRIKKASELYANGNIKLIQVTGSNAPGEFSEGNVAFEELSKLGVPKKNILIETETSTTAEQVSFIYHNLIIEKRLKRIAVISDSFHLFRIMQMAEFFNITVDGISSDYKLNWQKLIYYSLRDAAGLILFWLFAI